MSFAKACCCGFDDGLTRFYLQIFSRWRILMSSFILIRISINIIYEYINIFAFREQAEIVRCTVHLYTINVHGVNYRYIERGFFNFVCFRIKYK